MSHTEKPMPQYELDKDYPLLYATARAFDFAERLGGCSDALADEIDKALRELWNARRLVREPGGDPE